MFDVDTRFQRAASGKPNKDRVFYCSASEDVSTMPGAHKAFRITPIAVSSWKIEVMVLKSVEETAFYDHPECEWEVDTAYKPKYSRHPITVWARISPFTSENELRGLRTYLRLFEAQTERWAREQQERREQFAPAGKELVPA